MTRQEIFDKSYLAIIKQGRPSRNYTNSCCYRGPNNTACAIGVLISDRAAKAWDRRIDTRIHCILYKGRSRFIEPWMRKNSLLLERIQLAHDQADESSFIEDFKNKMALVAKKHNLTIPEIPE